MKRIFLCMIFSIIITPCFASIEDVISINELNENTQEIEINHNKPIYRKKGKYTYKYNKDNELLGYYEKTYSGKIIEYDKFGKKQYIYKLSNNGKIIIYNEKGQKIN